MSAATVCEDHPADRPFHRCGDCQQAAVDLALAGIDTKTRLDLAAGLDPSDERYFEKLDRRAEALFAEHPNGDPVGLSALDLDDLATRGRREYHTLDDLDDMPEPEWLVEQWLPADSVGYLIGRDASFKTFAALDLALSLLTFRPWHGHRVGTYGPTLFVAGEGVRSFGARVGAWLDHHGIELEPWQRESFVVRAGAVDLFAAGPDFDALLAKVRDLRPVLVVVDTLARSSGRAEQNSASDMSVITGRLDALRRATDRGGVLVVAHTDKGDRDARGSSAIEDNADFVLHAKRDEGTVELTLTKSKDGEDGHKLALRPLATAGSVVLVEAGPEPEWASDSLAQRIRGVLFKVRDVDEPTQRDVVTLLEKDGTDKPAGRTQVYDVLGKLVREGAVIATKAGSKATTYRLHTSQYPRDVL